MKITSPAFSHNGKIPERFTCDGENYNPALRIENVPVLAKSLVLIMDDPDIPEVVKQKFKTQMWDHWVVFDMPPGTKELEEDEKPPGIQGRTTGGSHRYGGPCPPDREHRYFFKLYALDCKLELPEGSTKAQVEKAMDGRVIARAELIGLYAPKKRK